MSNNPRIKFFDNFHIFAFYIVFDNSFGFNITINPLSSASIKNILCIAVLKGVFHSKYKG